MIRPLLAVLALFAAPGFQDDLEAKEKEMAGILRRMRDFETARKEGKEVDAKEMAAVRERAEKLMTEIAGPDRKDWETAVKKIVRKHLPDLLPELETAERASNERNASATLKTLTTAQADFRANDRDGNGTNDFWVGDVSGLYRISVGDAIKLIEPKSAAADATPVLPIHMEGKVGKGADEVTLVKLDGAAPKAGYHFAAIPSYVDGKGKTVKYHDGSMRHLDRFAFCAYPKEHGKTGERTFLVDENNTLWWKDTKGEAVKVMPDNPSAEGWAKLD